MKSKLSILVLLFGLIIASNTLIAQVNLSGDVGIRYIQEGRSTKVLSYTITPKIGVNLNENVIFGVLFGYSAISLKLNYNNEIKASYINLGLYSRINSIGSERIRLLFEPSCNFMIETENSDLMLSFAAVPVVQFSITEKVFFDVTLGLMGISLMGIPDSDYWELNFGFFSNSGISEAIVNSSKGFTLTPVKIGLTFSL